MASLVSSNFVVLILTSIFANSWMATVLADPADITYEIFEVLANKSTADDLINGNLFTFKSIPRFPSSVAPRLINVNQGTKYQSDDFEGLALATLQFPPGAVNPPNTNFHSAELLFLLEGTLEVGFIDTNNKLYTRTLQVGDLFVFPKGLVHFHYNPNQNSEARALAAYAGFPGSIFLPRTLLSSGVDDGILAMSFKTDVTTIRKLKAGLESRF